MWRRFVIVVSELEPALVERARLLGVSLRESLFASCPAPADEPLRSRLRRIRGVLSAPTSRRTPSAEGETRREAPSFWVPYIPLVVQTIPRISLYTCDNDANSAWMPNPEAKVDRRSLRERNLAGTVMLSRP